VQRRCNEPSAQPIHAQPPSIRGPCSCNRHPVSSRARRAHGFRYNQGPDARPRTHPQPDSRRRSSVAEHFVRRFARAAPFPDVAACDPPDRRGWRRPRRADSSPHSHSIINSFCKPLIRLANVSNRHGFTVRCTATSSGIPAHSFHHRSTSIEGRQRVHDGQLSRSIEIDRLLRTLPRSSTPVLAGRRAPRAWPASNTLTHCPA
jgi:hypothetical protein